MKTLKMILGFIFCLVMINAHAKNASGVTVLIKGKQAQSLFNTMTGSAVENEGAAGHLYRRGKSVLCKRINADMDDKQGNPVPSEDPRRYSCVIQFDNNGLASAGEGF